MSIPSCKINSGFAKKKQKINKSTQIRGQSEAVQFNNIGTKRGQACKFAKMGIFLNFNLFQFAKMSRKTRLYDSGILNHVILRGNGGQRIFR